MINSGGRASSPRGLKEGFVARTGVDQGGGAREKYAKHRSTGME